MGAKRLCLFLLSTASELFTWIRGSIEMGLMDSEKTVQFPLVDGCVPQKTKVCP